MLLGLSVLAAAAVPSGLLARGNDIVKLKVRQFASSPSGQVIVACTENRVVPIEGGASQVDIEAGSLVAADVTDEGWLALAHAGGITIHDARGRELLRLGGYTGTLVDLALSPDGSTFAVAAADRVALHRSADGLLLWSRSGQAWSVAFHPDGEKVIAGIETGNLVMKVSNGRIAGGFDTAPAVWFQWTPGALYTHAQGGPLQAWNPVTLKPTDEQPALEVRDTVAVHPDGSWMLVDGCVAAAGSVRPTSLCVAPATTASIFDAEGGLFVAAAGTVRRWEPLDGSSVTDLGLPPAGPRVTAIAAGDGGDWIVASEDGSLKRLAADGTAKFDARIPGCSADCQPAAIGGFGAETWVVAPHGQVQLWSAGGQPQLRGGPSKVIDAGRRPDGQWVALMSDGRVRIGAKPGKGRPSAALPGARAVVVGAEGYVVTGDLVHPFKIDGTPLPVARLGPDRVPRAVTVDTSGLAIAVLDDAGTLHRFSVDGRPVFREALGLAPDVLDIAWSADGAWLVVGGSPLRVFDAADGSPHIDVLLAPPGQATSLAASDFGFLGVVQGTHEREEVRLLRLSRRE